MTTVPAARRPTTLLRVVGEQADRPDAELGEHRRRFGVVARVDGQAEGNVGVDGVGAAVLGDVGAELVDQADAAAFVTGGVDEHAAPLGGDHPQPGSQLDAAVAAQRSERVAGEALGVEADEHVVAVAERRP